MTNEEKNSVAGAKSCITQKKLDNLYALIQRFNTASLVSKALGVDKRTYESWIEKGNEALKAHEEFASELGDCSLDSLIFVQDYINENREIFEKKFLEDTYATELGVKNIGRFNEHLDKISSDLLEQRTNELENEMIDNFVFNEHDAKNEAIRKYVKVARIASRAELNMKGVWLDNIRKHCGTGKNVGLSKWRLETSDDDFKAQPTTKVDINNSGTISFVDWCSSKHDGEQKEN